MGKNEKKKWKKMKKQKKEKETSVFFMFSLICGTLLP